MAATTAVEAASDSDSEPGTAARRKLFRITGGRAEKAVPRLAVLDGLRLVAALLVVLKHYVGSGVEFTGQGGSEVNAWTEPTSKLFPGWLYHLSVYGWTGVELFFLISGFVICMSSWGRSTGQFATSRVARLLPAYWAAVALTAAVVVLWPKMSSGPYPGRSSDILTNLSLLQGGYGVNHLDPVYWSLWSEIRFYALFSIVVAFGVTYRRVVVFCVLWLAMSVVAQATGASVLVFVFQPQYSPYFIAGIAMYLVYRFGSTPLLWGIAGLCWLLGQHLIRFDAIGELPSTGNPKAAMWPVTACLTLYFVIMAVIALRLTDRIRWRWLTVAGAMTYPLYLIHQDIGLTAIRYLRSDLSPMRLLVAVTIAMLVTSYLIHRVVERPAARWIRTGMKRSIEAMRAADRAQSHG